MRKFPDDMAADDKRTARQGVENFLYNREHGAALRGRFRRVFEGIGKIQARKADVKSVSAAQSTFRFALIRILPAAPAQR